MSANGPSDPPPGQRAGHGLWRSSLLGRMVVALLLVSLVPLLGIVWVLNRVYRPALTEQTLGTHSLVARNSAERVAAFLSVHRSLAEAVASNPAVASRPDSPAVQEFLAGILLAEADVAAIRLLDAAGEEVLRVQRREFSAEIERVLAAPPAEASVAGGLTAVAGELTLWIRQEVALAAGPSGVVQMVSAAGLLADVFRPQGLLHAAEVVLVDDRGRVLAGSAPSLDRVSPELVRRAVSGALAGTETVDSAEGQLLAAYQAVASSPWVVLSIQPRQDAEAAFHLMRRSSWLAIGVSILLTGALAAGTYATVVRPIRRLVRDQRRLAGLASTPSGGSEIAQLQDSFAVLERRLKDQEALGKVFLGRYQVLDVLGEGGMGLVFRGWDPKLQRPVALKTFRLGREMASDERRARAAKLLAEAVATARVRHPHVVAVYDVMEQEDVAFIAMELVDGVSLEDYLEHRQTLTPEEVVPLGLAIARGLTAAHAQGLVHHDVKPGNVLLGHEGGIKIMDFGIAQFLSAQAQGERKIFGTPGYLPPEALRGEGYGEAGDFFALGVILYEALVGHRPFGGKNVREILVHTLTDEPMAPSFFQPRVPPDLEAVVLGLLAKSPDERLVTSSGLEQRLEALPATREWKLDWSAPRKVIPSHERLRSRYCPTESALLDS